MAKKEDTFRGKTLAELNRLFPDVKVTDPTQAGKMIDVLEERTGKIIGQLQDRIEELEKKFLREHETDVAKGRLIRSPNQLLVRSMADKGRDIKVQGFDEIDRLKSFIKACKELCKSTVDWVIQEED